MWVRRAFGEEKKSGRPGGALCILSATSDPSDEEKESRTTDEEELKFCSHVVRPAAEASNLTGVQLISSVCVPPRRSLQQQCTAAWMKRRTRRREDDYVEWTDEFANDCADDWEFGEDPAE